MRLAEGGSRIQRCGFVSAPELRTALPVEGRGKPLPLLSAGRHHTLQFQRTKAGSVVLTVRIGQSQRLTSTTAWAGGSSHLLRRQTLTYRRVEGLRNHSQQRHETGNRQTEVAEVSRTAPIRASHPRLGPKPSNAKGARPQRDRQRSKLTPSGTGTSRCDQCAPESRPWSTAQTGAGSHSELCRVSWPAVGRLFMSDAIWFRS